MTNILQNLARNLNSLPFKGLAGLLVLIGAALFVAGALFATSILTLFSILSVAAGAVVAVVSLILRNIK